MLICMLILKRGPYLQTGYVYIFMIMDDVKKEKSFVRHTYINSPNESLFDNDNGSIPMLNDITKTDGW